MATGKILGDLDVVICNLCIFDILPSGNKTKRFTWAFPLKASTAADPVSPDVAVTMVVFLSSLERKRSNR